MSIEYNIIQRGEPGVEGGGTRKFYASAVTTNSVGIDELTQEIASLSTVNGADVRAVLHGIVEVLPKFLAKGNSVELGELGFFRVSISSKGSETEEEVSLSNIRRSRVLFRPGKKITHMLNNLEFSKI